MKNTTLRPFCRETARSAKTVYPVTTANRTDPPVPPSLKEMAALNAFSARCGTLLANREGVLLGLGDGKDPFATAAAAANLPDGNYILADMFGNSRNRKLACLGWLAGRYRFTRYRKAEHGNACLIAPDDVDVNEITETGHALKMAKDLINTPACDMTPAALETEMKNLACSYKAAFSSITGKELLAHNFPMIHAVGRASAVAPRLLDFSLGPHNAPRVTLIGKGVTFDSGGLNIKTPSSMALMKKDMGGAAHVLALARMLMSAGPDIRLRVLVPAVENAVSGNSFRPGDILDSRRGLSVEIGNTDAEGRLVLADAMALAAEDSPDLLITFATLTGAARVALGPDLAPYYCNNPDLAANLESAAAEVADPVWRLPLWHQYTKMLESPVADICHVASGSFAGSITAALFLERFIPPSVNWMHFDIFGWRPEPLPGRPAGARIQGVRAVYELLKNRYCG